MNLQIFKKYNVSRIEVFLLPASTSAVYSREVVRQLAAVGGVCGDRGSDGAYRKFTGSSERFIGSDRESVIVPLRGY